VINSSKEERLFEIFSCATYCPLLPVNRIVYRDTTITIQGDKVRKGLDKMISEAMKGPSFNNKWLTAFE
jgi:hypothetical protein